MKKSRSGIGIVAVLLVVAIGGWWMSARRAQNGGGIVAAPSTSESESLPPAAPVSPSAVPAQKQKSIAPPPAAMLPPEESDSPRKDLFIAPDRVLAKVNDTSLTLKDLLPLNPASTGQTLRAEAYAHLLAKAIEREVTFRGAKSRGAELSDSQKLDLENIRQAALARGTPPYAAPGYDAEAQAEFEVRDRTAQMLQNVLLNESAPPSQLISAQQIQEHYERHRAEFPPLPESAEARDKAWKAIETEIRSRLIPDVYREHERKRQLLMAELKAGVVIEPLVPPGNR